jgi:hypothetical protein
VLLLTAIALLHNVNSETLAQGGPTSTPAPVDLSGLAQPTQQFGPTITPTRTPTPQGPVQLEALDNANVRAAPDTTAEILGQIRPGEFYNVIRRYYSWIEFQYDQAPTRRGWVFGELVRFIGDESAIPVVDSLDATVEGMPDIDATSTALAITGTPGGLLTATAQARGDGAPVQGFGVSTPDPNNQQAGVPSEMNSPVLPTFTYPPGIIPLRPTEDPFALQATPTLQPAPRIVDAVPAIPPVTPIVALVGLGLIGFLVSAIKR